METTDQGLDFLTVARWLKCGSAAATQTSLTPAKKLEKVPAFLVCLKEGSSYVDTVAAVKATIDPTSLGVDISKIRRTQDGHAFI